VIVIGSRGSDLALAQSRWVAKRLGERGVETRLEIIRTRGDRNQQLSLAKLEGKGFFTKEIEEALLDGRIDLAVHSLKDLPTSSPAGLQVAAIPQREDPRDCLVMRREAYEPRAHMLPLREGASVGTGSVRRRAQLGFLRSDLRLEDLRGNVPTRIARLREGRLGAVLLAQAGLARLKLDLDDLYLARLETDRLVPAPGQGALALQGRSEDTPTLEAVAPLMDSGAARSVRAERDLLAKLEGGCHLPLGAHASPSEGGYRLLAFLGETERWGPARRVTVWSQEAEDLAARAFGELVPA
jgi:hydroxymethylbilane synthase